MNQGEYHNYKLSGLRMKDSDKIWDLRKKIEEMYGYDPSSYLITKCCENKLINIFHNNEKVEVLDRPRGVILLMEIPKELNPKFPPLTQIKKDDSNNGVSDEWVKIPIHFYKNYGFFGLVRFMWAKKSWTLKELHINFYNHHKDLFYRWLKEIAENGSSDKCKAKFLYKHPETGNTLDYSAFLELPMEKQYQALFPRLDEDNWKT